ncbi:hypothetical protein [Actinocatenispora rupis]|uniref:MFS transporter n=1 Tax=Actinocatenispora rupis TaxID=519421 RepID=A0A8J3J0L8_9ACTN|nr:hypothetical protein [Actinocatenispora rupis]GID12360.1 hypothetical protein Aru02nite_32490 [Actinocatenispora rupis]
MTTATTRRAPTTAELPVGVAQASLGFLLASLGPYVLVLADELHRPRQELGWLSSTFGGGLVLVAVAGLLTHGRHPYRVLRAASAALAVGATCAALAGSVPLAAVGALLIGVGGAGIVLATPALLRGSGAAARLARVTGASSAAGIAAPVLVAAVERGGPHGGLALLVPVPFLVLVAVWPVARRSAPVEAPPRSARPQRRQVAARWWCIVLAVSAEFCFTIWGAARLQDTGVSAATAAALSVAFPAGMAAGRLAASRLARSPHTVAAACLTAGTGTAMVCLPQAVLAVAAGLALAGLGIAVLYPVSLARLTETPQLSAGRSAALGALGSGTAVVTAPLVLAVVGAAVSLRVGFVLPAVLLAVLLVLSRRTRRIA